MITTVVPTAAGAGGERTRGTDWTVAVWVLVLLNPWPSVTVTLSAQVCETPVALSGAVHVVAGSDASSKLPGGSPPVQVDVHA